MSFPRYPKYKPSGVSWVGDAPEHWPTIRYKNVFKEKQSVSGDSLPSGSISFGRVVFKSDKTLHELTKASYQEVLAGEFLINPINLNYDLKSLRTGLSDINTCVSPAYIVLRAKAESDKNYLKYQLHLFDVSHMKTLGAGVRQTITFGDIGTCSTCLPPLAEQTAIAEFLDRETGKIDGLVGEQRRLMELLKEKRQAVISHAVTKGLNPHAPMKPSGIEWIGDVPAGWVIGKLGYACKLRGGFAFAAADFGTEGVAVVKMNNLKRGRLDLTEAARIPESSCNGSVALLKGDLVWGMSGSTGETGSLGNFARVRADDLPCQLNQRVGRFQVDSSKLDLNFVEHVIQTPYFYEQIMLLVTGTAQYNVSSEQVQSCIFVLPPVAEQTVITKFLDAELLKFDTLTAEAQRAIDLLQDRRTALISAAVTGQIDVRQHPKN